MRRITPRFEIADPLEGYAAVGGLPVPVTVNSLEDACTFITEMCSDVVKTCDGIRSVRELQQRGFYNFVSTYGISLGDFITQVNALEYTPTLGQRVQHTRRKKTVARKLEALVDALALVRPMANSLRFLFDQLPLEEEQKKKTVKKEEGTAATQAEPPAETKPLIKNEYVRYYLMNHLVDAFAGEIQARKVFAQRGFADLVEVMTAEPERALRSKTRTWSVVAALALAASIITPIYLGHRTHVAAQRRQDLTAFQETLQLDEIGQLGTQYAQKFNALLDRAKEFKQKYWLNLSTTANFYVCYKKMYKDQKGVPPLERLTELQPCLKDLEQRLARTGSAEIARRTYLDNFAGFTSFAQQEMDVLRKLEQDLGRKYQEELDKIKAHESARGYSHQDVRATVLSSKTTFEKARDGFHLQLAVELSPIEFYALALAQSEYSARFAPGLLWTLPRSVARLQADSDTLAARIMNEYLAQETPQLVKPAPFCDDGGYFDQASTMASRLHEELNKL